MQAGREEQTQGRVYSICTASQSLNFSIPLLQLFMSKYKSVYIEYPCMGMHVLPKPRRQRIPELCSTRKLQLPNSRRGSDAPASEYPPAALWAVLSPDRTAQHSTTLSFLHCRAALRGSAAPWHKVGLSFLLGKPKLHAGCAGADKRAGTAASRCCSRGTGHPAPDPFGHLLPGLQKSHLLRETAAHLAARLCWYLACPSLHLPPSPANL